jgi:hypothetical protein
MLRPDPLLFPLLFPFAFSFAFSYFRPMAGRLEKLENFQKLLCSVAERKAWC